MNLKPKQARTKQTEAGKAAKKKARKPPKKIAKRFVSSKIKRMLQIIYEACGFTREEALDESKNAPYGETKTHAWREALVLVFSNAKIDTKSDAGGKLYVPGTPGDVVGPYLAHKAIVDKMESVGSENYLPMVLKYIIHEVGSRIAQFEDEDEFPKQEFIGEMKSVEAVQMGNMEYSDVRCKVVEANEYGNDELIDWLKRVHGTRAERYDTSEEGLQKTMMTTKGVQIASARLMRRRYSKEFSKDIAAITSAKADQNQSLPAVEKAIKEIAKKKKQDMTISDDDEEEGGEDKKKPAENNQSDDDDNVGSEQESNMSEEEMEEMGDDEGESNHEEEENFSSTASAETGEKSGGPKKACGEGGRDEESAINTGGSKKVCMNHG